MTLHGAHVYAEIAAAFHSNNSKRPVTGKLGHFRFLGIYAQVTTLNLHQAPANTRLRVVSLRWSPAHGLATVNHADFLL